MNKDPWLQQCFLNWTRSSVQTEAWKYRNDFDGFCLWFLQGESR